MDTEGLLKKLKYRLDLRATILNAPKEYEEVFGGLGFSKALGISKSQFTILFIRNKAELDRSFKETIGGMEEDSLFWLAYPKGGSSIKSDLNRDIIWELIKSSGYRPVSLVSMDADWSAMRVRQESKVKTSAL